MATAARASDAPIPAPPRSVGGIRYRWITTKLVRVALLWAVVVGCVFGILFGVVVSQENAKGAFNVFIGGAAPVGNPSTGPPNAGLPGVLLALVGYLLVPAVVGAVVAGFFTRSQTLPDRAYRRKKAKLAKRIQKHTSPTPDPRPAAAAPNTMTSEP